MDASPQRDTQQPAFTFGAFSDASKNTAASGSSTRHRSRRSPGVSKIPAPNFKLDTDQLSSWSGLNQDNDRDVDTNSASAQSAQAASGRAHLSQGAYAVRSSSGIGRFRMTDMDSNLSTSGSSAAANGVASHAASDAHAAAAAGPSMHAAAKTFPHAAGAAPTATAAHAAAAFAATAPPAAPPAAGTAPAAAPGPAPGSPLFSMGFGGSSPSKRSPTSARRPSRSSGGGATHAAGGRTAANKPVFTDPAMPSQFLAGPQQNTGAAASGVPLGFFTAAAQPAAAAATAVPAAGPAPASGFTATIDHLAAKLAGAMQFTGPDLGPTGAHGASSAAAAAAASASSGPAAPQAAGSAFVGASSGANMNPTFSLGTSPGPARPRSKLRTPGSGGKTHARHGTPRAGAQSGSSAFAAAPSVTPVPSAQAQPTSSTGAFDASPMAWSPFSAGSMGSRASDASFFAPTSQQQQQQQQQFASGASAPGESTPTSAWNAAPRSYNAAAPAPAPAGAFVFGTSTAPQQPAQQQQVPGASQQRTAAQEQAATAAAQRAEQQQQRQQQPQAASAAAPSFAFGATSGPAPTAQPQPQPQPQPAARFTFGTAGTSTTSAPAAPAQPQARPAPQQAPQPSATFAFGAQASTAAPAPAAAAPSQPQPQPAPRTAASSAQFTFGAQAAPGAPAPAAAAQQPAPQPSAAQARFSFGTQPVTAAAQPQPAPAPQPASASAPFSFGAASTAAAPSAAAQPQAPQPASAAGPFTFGAAKPATSSTTAGAQPARSGDSSFFGNSYAVPSMSTASTASAAAAPVFSVGNNAAESSCSTPGSSGGAGRRVSRTARRTPQRQKQSSGGAAAAAAQPSATAAPQQQPAPSAPAAAAAAGPHLQQQRSASSSAGGAASAVAAAKEDAAARNREIANLYKTQGNSSYAAERYQEAEHSYTLAIRALEAVGVAGVDLAVLHSNRAGARLMVGRPHAALEDAATAMRLDGRFFRAVSRAATCYCRLGDFASACNLLDATLDKLSASSQHFQDLYKKLKEVQALRAQVEEVCAALSAAGSRSGGQHAKLLDCLKQVADVHPQVVYSEPVAALRARALLQAGHLAAATSACEVSYEAPDWVRAAPWRMWITAQAKYHQGDLQASMTVIESQLLPALASLPAHLESQLGGANGPAGVAAAGIALPTPEQARGVCEHLRKLLALKEEGNAAVKAGSYAAALEKYGAALALGACPAYAAVLHGNRAAAQQGLGSIMDALAECGRAKALDPAYARAYTRMATLLMEVRRPEAAAQQLDALLNAGSSGSSAKPGSGPHVAALASADRSGAQQKLQEAKSAAAWQKTPDHYKLLGLERTCSEEEVRKAYRKAALRHHPDKAVAACKYVMSLPDASGPAAVLLLGFAGSGASSSSADAAAAAAGSSTDIEGRLREEANWLFNLISTANEELSDKSRRRKVDQLLDVERAPSTSYGTSRPGGSTFGRTGMGGGYGGFPFGSNPYEAYAQHFRSHAYGATGTAGSSSSSRRGYSGNTGAGSGGAGGASGRESGAGHRSNNGTSGYYRGAGGTSGSGRAAGGTGTGAGQQRTSGAGQQSYSSKYAGNTSKPGASKSNANTSWFSQSNGFTSDEDEDDYYGY